MPNKFWVFGDSFSTQDLPPTPSNPSGKMDHLSWLGHVCKGLQIQEANIHADYGVSNDWIFHEFTTNINNMEEGDYVIIQPTQKHRQWFFEDPCISNYWIKDLEHHVSKEESTAVEMYVTHLQNDKLDDLRYVQFCLALERLGQLAQHLRILVLPGFFGVNGVIGTLVSISDAEFDKTTTAQKYYDANDGKDPRLNHMSAVNHEILGNKIVEFFNTGASIDLTKDFKAGFLK
jgi:hypothetical protein